MAHVSEYMTSGPFAVGPREPLTNAARLMDKYELHHLPVSAEGKLIGVLSDHDVQQLQTLALEKAREMTVGEVMTPDPYAPSPDTPLVDVVRTMAERRIGSAVIVDQGRVVGVFTTTDAMRALIDALDARGAAR